MKFIACGINHKTAPLTLREKISPSIQAQKRSLVDLLGQTPASEAVILTTCNRTELYCQTADANTLIPWMAQYYNIGGEQLQAHSYSYFDDDAMRHTIRVACGLDSMMLGEPQIFGQMKQAYQQACEIGTIGQALRDRFRHVFATSKQIRTHTQIGKNSISIAKAAADVVKANFDDLAPINVLLIGSGDTTRLVAKYLKQYGVTSFKIANRTVQHSLQFASQINGLTVDINHIEEALISADLVISATACPIPFIDRSMVEYALTKKQQQKLMLIDLAVPRDISTDVADIDDVTLLNIDDFSHNVTAGLKAREKAAIEAEQMIELELTNYQLQMQTVQQANEAISRYRHHAESVRQLEIERALQSIKTGTDVERVLTDLSRRLVNKLAHDPTVRLRQAAQEGDGALLKLLQQLYTEPQH